MPDDASSSVAIVGMAAVFPGAATLDAFWSNIVAGVDAIGEVPASRWDPAFYDPSASGIDRFYCKRGGFIDDYATFDAVDFGVMPAAAEGAEPDQLLCLRAAAAALADAGCPRPASERTGIIMGRGGYLTPGMARLDQHVRTAEQLAVSLRGLIPGLTEAQLDEVKREFRAQLGAVGPDSAIGLVPNLAASRVANRLDLRGPAYTVDAACASSLVAIDQACSELRTGRCDLMLAGGVHLCHDVTFWSVFNQLGALSRSQRIRPFDRDADGLLIGEGVGIIVLKRLVDAERAGDRIWAVIRGTGVASDGRASTLMSPRVEGQVLALQRAWADARLSPQTVGLIEAHGTATPAGDAAELRTLRQVFGDEGAPVALGSVKSMIGHAMPAAGIAGVIKAALALHHQVLPPTLHCEAPHPLLQGARLRTSAAAAPWHERRRAAINAFGFGGINAHLVLDAVDEAPRRARRTGGRSVHRSTPALALYAADDLPSLDAMLAEQRPAGRDGRCRVALLDPSPERRERARQLVARERPWNGRKDIWLSPDALALRGGKLAFVFPGLEATFDPRVDDLAARFGIDVPPVRGATELERHGTALVSVSRVLDLALARLGVRPDVIAGHSVGEWAGMIAADMIPQNRIEQFLDTIAPGGLEVPDVAFLAVGAGADRVREVIAELPAVAISHDNCPHQSILCGPDADIAEASTRLRAARILSQLLPFRSGFHSKSFAPHLAGPRANIEALPLGPPRVPVYSATTCAPYPTELPAVRALMIDHLVESVRFRQLTQRLHRDGVRLFVQVGGGSLVSFIEDTLRDEPHRAVAASDSKRSGLEQLRRLGAALWVEGVDVDFECLPGALLRGERAARKSAPMRLALGAPLVRSARPLEGLSGSGSQGAAHASFQGLSPAVARELQTTLGQLHAVSTEISQALQRRPTAAPSAAAPIAAAPIAASHSVAAPSAAVASAARIWKVPLSVVEYPELLDHCFYRQPAGWSSIEDRFPVVPMTAQLDRMMRVAAEIMPGKRAVALENVRAFRWCAVAPALEVEVRAQRKDQDRVEVRIGDYALGTVVMAERYPQPPAPSQRLIAGAAPSPVDAVALYRDRWMFHGPKYHGVSHIQSLGSDGIRGTLITKPAPGQLLDNAGQLMGFWLMMSVKLDRLAFPMRIERMEFYGEHPAPGAELQCTVWIRDVAPVEVKADMELIDASGQLWCRVSGWVDRRFDSDAVLWPVLLFPEQNLAAEPQPGGYVRCRERWTSAASRELIARRFLDSHEREQWNQLGPRRRRGWLLGRIAIKDAVRNFLRERDGRDRFPIEVAVRAASSGRPRIEIYGESADDLRVSVAHKPDIAVAIVGEGRDVGIDIETIEARGDGFASLAFHDHERELARGADEAEWQTRLWAAKEAAAKAAGTGLEGNPRRFRVRERAGHHLQIEGPDGVLRWIATERDGDYIIAWTTEL